MKIMIALLLFSLPIFNLQANCGGQGKGNGQGNGQKHGQKHGQGKEKGTCNACKLPVSAEPGSLVLPVAQWERLWMDEIVAHDLYTQLDEKTQKRIFQNIKQSELHHREMIAALLTSAGHTLPETPEAGKYPDPELQKLYTEKVKQGMESESDAFKSGEQFEILDIAELEAALKTEGLSEPEIQVLTALRDASKRHLSAFQRQLGK
jgi:hypothetical protein